MIKLMNQLMGAKMIISFWITNSFWNETGFASKISDGIPKKIDSTGELENFNVNNTFS